MSGELYQYVRCPKCGRIYREETWLLARPQTPCACGMETAGNFMPFHSERAPKGKMGHLEDESPPKLPPPIPDDEADWWKGAE